MNVAILHPPVAPDASRDDLDTLVQVGAVEEALLGLGHAPVRVDFSPGSAAPGDRAWDLSRVAARLAEARPAAVFNLVETVAGRCRFAHLATTFLDVLGLPYTGTPTEGLVLAGDKLRAKRLLRLAGVATPRWFGPEDLCASFAGRRGRLSGSYLVKSVWEHASLGLEEDAVLASPTPDELLTALRERGPALGGACFAEAYVPGREFNLSVLWDQDGPRVLPPAEMEFVGDGPAADPSRLKIVGYKAKWDEDSPEYRSTVRLFDFPDTDAALLERLRDAALAVWRLFGLAGYARVDFRVDEDRVPQVIDVNANPGLAPDAGLTAAAARAGLSYPGLIGRILQAADPLAKPGAAAYGRPAA
jgi:D-alanine-D-alanine ligase